MCEFFASLWYFPNAATKSLSTPPTHSLPIHAYVPVAANATHLCLAATLLLLLGAGTVKSDTSGLNVVLS
jgi:hypothetical protein